MRALLAPLLLLAACGDLDPLVGSCPLGAECVLDDNGEATTAVPDLYRTGACHPGRVTGCDSGGTPVCEGYRDPEVEQCDGADHDCDGEVANVQIRLWFSPGYDCPGAETGHYATEQCVDERWVCRYDGPPPCDDGAVEYSYPEAQYPGTVGVGVCAPEIERCVGGDWRVTPAVTPTEDVCGDGLDNDCDGVVDNRADTIPAPSAFALVVDVSGSMGTYHAAYATAVCDLAGTAPFAGSTFAIVTVGGAGPEPDGVALYRGFESADDACSDLSAYIPEGVVDEYQLRGAAFPAQLPWPPGVDRHVVVMSDEELHYFQTDDGSSLESACSAAGYDLGVFASASTRAQWQQFTASCGGFDSPLDAGSEPIRAQMVSYYGGGCR